MWPGHCQKWPHSSGLPGSLWHQQVSSGGRAVGRKGNRVRKTEGISEQGRGGGRRWRGEGSALWLQWCTPDLISSILNLTAPFLSSDLCHQNRRCMSEKTYWRLGSLPGGNFTYLIGCLIVPPPPAQNVVHTFLAWMHQYWQQRIGLGPKSIKLLLPNQALLITINATTKIDSSPPPPLLRDSLPLSSSPCKERGYEQPVLQLWNPRATLDQQSGHAVQDQISSHKSKPCQNRIRRSYTEHVYQHPPNQKLQLYSYYASSITN